MIVDKTLWHFSTVDIKIASECAYEKDDIMHNK